MQLNPEKVAWLAKDWDPEPLLKATAQFSSLGPDFDLTGQYLTQPTNQDELGQILNPETQAPGAQGAAPIPGAMQMMQQFMPQQQQGPIPMAPATPRPQAPNMQLPMPQATPMPAGIDQILAGRGGAK